MKVILAVLCAYLVYLLEIAAYKRNWKKRLRVMPSFSAFHAVEGESAVLEEVVENEKLFPLPALRIKFSVPRGLAFEGNENITQTDKLYKNDIFSVLPYRRITRKHTVLCKKRGLYAIDSVSVSSQDLMMAKNFVDVRPVDTALTVYPAKADMKRLLPIFTELMGERQLRAQITDPFSFCGIRDYAPTDPQRSINWKASAKTGELKVNMYDSTRTGEVQLILNLSSDTQWADNALREEAIRVCATLCTLFVSKGVKTAVMANGRDVVSDAPVCISGGTSSAHIHTVKEALARVELSKECTPISEFTERLASGKNPQVIYITCSTGDGKTVEEIAKTAEDTKVFYIKRPSDEPYPAPNGITVFHWEVGY